jgi:adenosylcobyric acid synthase
MLGTLIIDKDGLEGAPSQVAGLGLLDVQTVMVPQKRLALSNATYLPTGDPVSGYEIHLGVTDGADCERGWLSLDGRPEGAASSDGKVMGCYLHGLFVADAFRAAFLERLGKPAAMYNYAAGVQDTLDALAEHLEQHFDIDRLLTLAN